MARNSTAYFGVLDTVNFHSSLPSDELAHRTLNASGAVMLHMLLGNVHPVLSQTQAFDCAVLNSGLARMDEDSLAMIELVRGGQIQVKILDSPLLRGDPADGHRFTLLNAFRSALERPDFRFASWPELEDDMELRRAVAEQLDRDPLGVDAVADGLLLQRLLGIIEFDRALRGSPVSERASPVAGKSLGARVLTALADIRRGRTGTEVALLTRLEARVRASDDRSLFDRRSVWYGLLDEYEPGVADDGDPSAVRQSAIVRGVVNAGYNEIVAESLGAGGMDMEIPDFETAGIVTQAGIEQMVGARATQVLSESPVADWLTWTELNRILRGMQHISVPHNRFRYLASKCREYYVPHRASEIAKNQVWAHISAAPVSITGATIGGVVGLMLGGDVFGTLAAGHVGALGGVYANYVLDSRKQRAFRKAEIKAQREFDRRFQPVLGSGNIAYQVDHDS